MTPEKQRIAIAEACGWKIEPDSGFDHTPFTVREPDGAYYHVRTEAIAIKHLPDYPNDLNAMHNAWLTLSDDNKWVFAALLQRVVFKGGGGNSWNYWPSNATASQRAEAFLKTIEKWEDET
jgi:hypothetical protein